VLACSAGKDVYVEKPLSLFVREGRWMVDVADRTKRVVQVGTQQRSGLHYQRARQLIRDGHIGNVHSVRMHSYRNIVPGFGSPPDCDPPAELDWNMFLGPAPLRRYNPQRGIYHFRWFWDYSGGQMTNLGHHSLDIVRWVLGVEPQAVVSFGGRFALGDNGETSETSDLRAGFQFGVIVNNAGPVVTVTVAADNTRSTLNDLVPGYIAAIPLDPLAPTDGGTLTCKLTPQPKIVGATVRPQDHMELWLTEK